MQSDVLLEVEERENVLFSEELDELPSLIDPLQGLAEVVEGG